MVFADDGEDKHVDGPHFACSFKQSCGLAVEFGEVVYVTDVTSASVNIITKFEKNVQFLRTLGGLYDAFSVHPKGAKYIRNNLLDALALIGPCFSFLNENQKDIRSSVPTQLPANLQGPQGNIASKTIVSVGLVQLGVSRLYEISEKYCSYSSTDLRSCMTDDVEHLHSISHTKSPTLSMLQYARTLGEMMKEMCKRLSNWGVHYFTKPTSWYPLQQGTVKFEDLPHMELQPPVEMRKEDIKQLLD